MAMDMRKLAVRSVSGLLYVGVIAWACLSGEETVTILAVVLAALGCIELETMCGKVLTPNPAAFTFLDVVMCAILAYCGADFGDGDFFSRLFPFMLVGALMAARFISQLQVKSAQPLVNLATSVLSWVYIGLPMFFLTLFPSVADQYGNYVLLIIFCMIWINDTGAFLVGSMMGRHKLFERISPKKTWEGFAGGLCFNIIAAIGISYISPVGREYSILMWIGAGILVSIAGTLGDLVESQMKRSAGVKDSGHLIPGHGGILDRIDSLIMVIPIMTLYFGLLACL